MRFLHATLHPLRLRATNTAVTANSAGNLICSQIMYIIMENAKGEDAVDTHPKGAVTYLGGYNL